MSKQTEQQSTSNWGKGLFAVIALFICSTLGIVAFLTSLDFQIVTEHYYEKAENYEQHIEQVEHARALREPVEIALVDNEIQLRFPASIQMQNPKGTIELYRPSDAGLDQQLQLSLDKDGTQHIATGDLTPGKWSVKIYWSTGDKRFFKEQNLFL